MDSWYGYTSNDWQAMIDAAYVFLRDQAGLERLSSYTELKAVLAQRTAARALDFSRDADRKALGDILGEVSRRSHEEHGVLLSAIVIYLNENDAGPGFYKIATHFGLLGASPSVEEKLDFWSKEVARAHAAFG